MKNILLLGSLTNKKDPTKTGGIVVLFELLLTELKKRNIKHYTIDTLVENYSNPLSALLLVWFRLFKLVPKYDHISLQATTNGLLFIGPVLIVLAKIYKKDTSIRVFAGDLVDIYESANFLKKYVIRFVLKNIHINFFETKYLIEYFKFLNKNTYWMPNVREKNSTKSKLSSFRKKFIYVGTINKEKGIDTICEIVKNIHKDITFDVYGPIIEDKYSKAYFKKFGVSYCGALKAEEVLGTMERYDVLVLPSFREGYPGVIIEAFSLGMPIIASKLDGISEMVEDGITGTLIEAGNSQELLDAIHGINSENFAELQNNALQAFTHYDSEINTDNFLKKINLI